jgi:hypothetical protein
VLLLTCIYNVHSDVVCVYVNRPKKDHSKMADDQACIPTSHLLHSGVVDLLETRSE